MTSDGKTRIQWMIFVALVLFIKGVLVFLDHRPMFFLGDSWAYIGTAVNDTIPADRSFTYGYIIRDIALRTRSLGRLVAFQALLGAFNSILLAFLLRKYFRTSGAVAFAMGLLNAVEPLQLMYERYVLTETVALFVFTLYVALIFQYIAQARLFTLLLIPVAAIMLVSLRFSFLPLVYAAAFVIPLLATWKFIVAARGTLVVPSRKSLFAVVGHMIVSIGLLGFLITGYKHVNGNLSNRPPAIQYAVGRFLVAGWTPVVEPQDFPRPDLMDAVFGGLAYDLKDRTKREDHRWHEGGLVRSIEKAALNGAEADRLSKETALNALRRDPLGVARVTLLTYADYFNIRYLKECMNKDRGLYELRPEFLNLLRKRFWYTYDSTPGLSIRSLTGSLFFRAWPWYCLLALLPVPALFGMFICRRESRRHAFVLLLFSIIILAPVLLIGPHPVARYLHPLAWMAILVVGIFADRLVERIKTTFAKRTR